MAILRILKWIFFSVFIVSLALFGVGHYFAISDMSSWIPLQSGEDGVLLSTVKQQLDARNLLGNVKEANDITPALSIATDGEVNQITDEAQEPATDDISGYTLEGQSKIKIIAMKLGVSASQMKWLTEPLHLENTEITLSLFVAYSALLLAFLLHIITKRHKTIYGTFLMVIGFIFIIGFYAVSYFPIEKIIRISSSSVAKSNDFSYVTVFFVTFFSLLGALFGIPIYSCGVRQITCCRLKKRLRRRSASADKYSQRP